MSSNSGVRGADLLGYIVSELGVAPLLDSGTDLEDELPSPDALPMVMGHGVAILPAQGEEDVDLAQVLAEFGTLPATVTPIHDPQEAQVVPPAEYRPPEAPVDVLVAPAGPTVVADNDVRPPTGRWAVRRLLSRLRRCQRRRGTCSSQDRRGLIRHLGESRRIIDYRRLP